MSEPSPDERVWNLLRGALGTRALAIVAELGVADALADGPRPVAEVAEEVGADPDTLHRLLRALASEGVFAEHEPGVFGNTDASELTRREAAWGDFAHLFGGVWYRTMGELGPTGEPSFPKAFGTDFWAWLAAHPSERAAFDRSMQQGMEPRVERLAALDWRGDETVVDVGGGNGSVLAALLRLRPSLRGIVFDLPETVRDEEALGERIEFVEGDFFDRVPGGRRLHPLGDPPRLERRAGGRDPPHDPRRGPARGAPADRRRRRRGGERAGRDEVARPAHARAARRPGARRAAVARAARGRRLRAGRDPGRADRSRACVRWRSRPSRTGPRARSSAGACSRRCPSGSASRRRSIATSARSQSCRPSPSGATAFSR